MVLELKHKLFRTMNRGAHRVKLFAWLSVWELDRANPKLASSICLSLDRGDFGDGHTMNGHRYLYGMSVRS